MYEVVVKVGERVEMEFDVNGIGWVIDLGWGLGYVVSNVLKIFFDLRKWLNWL